MATQSENLPRPLTPFLLFSEKQRKKGSTASAKELGEKWQKMSGSQKKKYIDEYKTAKDKYDRFLEEVYGSEPLTYRPGSKPTEFSLARVRGVLGLKSAIKPMAKGLYPGLVKVLEAFFKDLGKETMKTMRDEGRKVLDLETLIKTLEDSRKFGLVTYMEDYNQALNEAEAEAEKAREAMKAAKEARRMSMEPEKTKKDKKSKK